MQLQCKLPKDKDEDEELQRLVAAYLYLIELGRKDCSS
jgi:hypothetical protein